MQWTKNKLSPFPLYYIDNEGLSLECWFDRPYYIWRWALFSVKEDIVLNGGKAGNANDCMNQAKLGWMV